MSRIPKRLPDMFAPSTVDGSGYQLCERCGGALVAGDDCLTARRLPGWHTHLHPAGAVGCLAKLGGKTQGAGAFPGRRDFEDLENAIHYPSDRELFDQITELQMENEKKYHSTILRRFDIRELFESWKFPFHFDHIVNPFHRGRRSERALAMCATWVVGATEPLDWPELRPEHRFLTYHYDPLVVAAQLGFIRWHDPNRFVPWPTEIPIDKEGLPCDAEEMMENRDAYADPACSWNRSVAVDFANDESADRDHGKDEHVYVQTHTFRNGEEERIVESLSGYRWWGWHAVTPLMCHALAGEEITAQERNRLLVSMRPCDMNRLSGRGILTSLVSRGRRRKKEKRRREPPSRQVVARDFQGRIVEWTLWSEATLLRPKISGIFRELDGFTELRLTDEARALFSQSPPSKAVIFCEACGQNYIKAPNGSTDKTRFTCKDCAGPRNAAEEKESFCTASILGERGSVEEAVKTCPVSERAEENQRICTAIISGEDSNSEAAETCPVSGQFSAKTRTPKRGSHSATGGSGLQPGPHFLLRRW